MLKLFRYIILVSLRMVTVKRFSIRTLFKGQELSNLVKSSGLFLIADVDEFEVVEEWSKTYKFFEGGEYEKAKRTRVEILEKIYQRNGILDEGYFPPILSNQFIGPIGHHAVLGLHIAGQKMGLLPPGKRTVLIPNQKRINPTLKLYESDVNFVKFQEGSGWTELPNFWHFSERLQVFRGLGTFIEGYEFTDNVFRLKQINTKNAFFGLSEEYLLQCYQELERFGFYPNDWFVGLHIRDGSSTPSLRNQRVSNYVPAIKEITERGGWVIRIGGEEMPPLPKMKHVIDLVKEIDALREVHLFVLASALFFIGTCSGPQYFPPLFGVPTLFTNQIGSGRSILTFSEHSIHLPKTYTDSDAKPASFTQMLSSPFGYGELTLEQYRKMGINIRENTSLEILEAVQEMFSRISGEVISLDQEFDFEIDRIRNLFPWTSKGRIANSFLRRNSDWFLGDRNK